MEFNVRAPRYWRGVPFRYRLEGYRCEDCGEFHFSVRKACRKCGKKALRPDRLPERGKLLTFTYVRTPPKSFEPFVLGVIQMEDGTKLVAQLTDCEPEQLEEGMAVEATFRRLRADGDSKLIVYGVKFRPTID